MSKVACLHCDLLIDTIALSSGESAYCPRCQQVLYHDEKSLSLSVALLLTALIIYFPATLLPFLGMETAGQYHEITLFSSILEIAHGRTAFLALTVFMLVLSFPLIKFIGLLSILLPLLYGRLPFFGLGMTRFILRLMPWSMVEVYLIGVLVTLVKLSSMATISFLGGFYAFTLLIVINAAIGVILPKKRIWQTIDKHLQRITVVR